MTTSFIQILKCTKLKNVNKIKCKFYHHWWWRLHNFFLNKMYLKKKNSGQFRTVLVVRQTVWVNDSNQWACSRHNPSWSSRWIPQHPSSSRLYCSMLQTSAEVGEVSLHRTPTEKIDGAGLLVSNKVHYRTAQQRKALCEVKANTGISCGILGRFLSCGFWLCLFISVSWTIVWALLTCCFPVFPPLLFWVWPWVWVFVGVLLSPFTTVSLSVPFVFIIALPWAAVLLSPSGFGSFLVFMSTFSPLPPLLVFSITAVIAAAHGLCSLTLFPVTFLLFFLFLLFGGFFGLGLFHFVAPDILCVTAFFAEDKNKL